MKFKWLKANRAVVISLYPSGSICVVDVFMFLKRMKLKHTISFPPLCLIKKKKMLLTRKFDINIGKGSY